MEKQFKYPKSDPNLSGIQFTDELKQKVLERVNKPDYSSAIKRRRPVTKKIFYAVAAPIAAVALLIASTYISPTMAKVAAKIPYFHWFVQQEDVRAEIRDCLFKTLKEKNIPMASYSASIPNKEITIGVELSEIQLKNQKHQITRIIHDTLMDNNYGKYKITLKKANPNVGGESTKEDIQNQKDSIELERKIQDYLDKNNYVTAFPIRVQIGGGYKGIYVALPKTDDRKDELKEVLLALSKEYGDFELKVTRVDMNAREQEKRWERLGIISILANGLTDNKEFKITGFSYSFPLEITLKTSLHSSDKDAKALAQKIEEEIDTFIQTDEITKEVRNDPYRLIILGKDKKVIKQYEKNL